jgi:hypothetical protein
MEARTTEDFDEVNLNGGSRGRSLMVEVFGAYHYNELDDGFHVRVIFKCPFCQKRHKQFVKGKGRALNGVELETKCGHKIRVNPYRSLER